MGCYYHCAKALLRSQLWKPDRWPTDRFKIQLGKQLAKSSGKDQAWASEFDVGLDQRAFAVESEYIESVWKPQVHKKPFCTLSPNQLGLPCVVLVLVISGFVAH